MKQGQAGRRPRALQYIFLMPDVRLYELFQLASGKATPRPGGDEVEAHDGAHLAAEGDGVVFGRISFVITITERHDLAPAPRPGYADFS
ncbi:hypothetical protein EVAR_48488_1 [Eumeta japonica]|uniref:Uncharacterized protein n=1 Tax=Eumeta variegata TaxID=151549 RepID=A0A4C1XJD8_EUMVA|nr:hypothetical protein EVAR_48488_1 [Eumeta japonica]